MPAGSWPTVGRNEDLHRLGQMVDQACSGSGSLVLVEGEAGAGKTHLLDALRATITGRSDLRTGPTDTVDDLEWLRARVSNAELSVPFAAPLTALGASLADLGVGSGAPRSMIEAGAGEIGQAVVIDGLLRLVEERCGTNPVVLVLDDVHAADSGTVAWLDQLRSRLEAFALALVLASRPPVPGSPFESFRQQLGTDEVLALRPLSHAQVDEMVTRVHGASPGPRLRAALADTQGLPLFVTAVLESVDHDGLVTTDAGVDLPLARARRMARAPDAVAARIRSVTHELRQVLLAAAVLGEDFVVGHVRAVLGVPLADVTVALAAADRAGLIVANGPTYRFRHEFYRQAVLATAAAPVVAALHGAAAEACIATSEPSIVVARHLVAAGASGPETADWLVDAAETVVAYEPENALTMADAAMRAVGSAPTRRLLTVRGRALASVGRVAEAEALLRQMLASSASAVEELGLRRELALALFQQGRPAESMTEMARAVELAPDEPTRARLRAEESFTHLLVGGFDLAGEIAAEEMAAGAALGDLTTEVAAAMVSCLVSLYHGHFAKSLHLADRLEELTALAATSEAAVYQPWFAAGMARVEADDHVGARRIAMIGQARCIEAGYQWMVPGYDALAAYCSLRSGELDDAIAEAAAALDWRIEDRLGVAVWCHAFTARAVVHRGDLDMAERQLAAADRLIDQGRAQLGWDHVSLARAALFERRDDPGAAYAALCDAWDLHMALGVRSAVQECGPELVRLGVLVGERDRIADVLAVLDDAAERIGDATRLGDRDRARAWADHDRDLLISAIGHYRRSPRALIAATTTAELATWYAEAGERVSLKSVAVAARDGLNRCGATGDARRLDDIAGRSSRRRHLHPTGADALSRTETRVVALVAEGLANSEIADQLHVSRRTVESHVSAAYRKLGVTNRVELARAALGLTGDRAG